ncbi:endo-1,4-beta-xylanase [Saccharomonospora iraqiensis]|uniref:endo-1,4-beta-xylanase n=1 Tax=Saccharomonospora iraqiensis TaxID=52698 RepID=UPI00022E0049|nr:endo-1,4-beta-xylanase [Saccharomonospora iraqiensis]
MKSVRLVTAALATAAVSATLTAPAAAAVPGAAGAGSDQPGQSRPGNPHFGGPGHPHPGPPGLRRFAPEGFRIGSAVAGGGHHAEQPYPDPFGSDTRYRRELAAQFDSLSPENQMKWEYLRPEPGVYDFDAADAIVDFAERNGQVVRGHTLLWHSQNPEWLEQGDFTADELRTMLREHITTVVGRYAGRIQQWDVANEIFDSQGALRTEENIWIRELGPGIIADAFRWAHEADPEADLFFNDYGVAGTNAKSDAYYALITDLRDEGVPVHGFSAQAHLSLSYGFPADMEDNLRRFDDLGVATAVTELDVRMELPDSGVPTRDQLGRQADYYGRALTACLNVDGCDSFTIWGVPDRYSWVPVFFEGQGAATVLWDDYSPKPAYHGLRMRLARAGHGAANPM